MEKLLTPKEVASIVGVDRMTVYKWIRQGKLEATKIGTMRRIKEVDLQSFVNKDKNNA